jgi:hypothetical protein
MEDLQIPPGQECSNGSMILLAVVLWRTSFYKVARASGLRETGWQAGRMRYYETCHDQNVALLPDCRNVR